MNEFERNIPPQSEIDNDDLETGEELTDEQAEQSDVESETFGIEEAATLEKETVQGAADNFKEQFKDKLDNLTTTAKQKVAKALMVIFLATTIAGMAPERSNAADLDSDKDRQEEVGDRLEPDPEKMLGFEVDFMTKEEAREFIVNFIDFIENYKPQAAGELLAFEEFTELNTIDGDNDNWDTISDDESGTLPEQGENLIIVNGETLIDGTKNDNDDWDGYHGLAFRSEIYGVADGYSIEAVGEPIEVNGYGDNVEDALRNAILNSVGFYGMSESALHTTQETHSGPNIIETKFSQEFGSKIVLLTEEAICSYQMTEVVDEVIDKANEDGTIEKGGGGTYKTHKKVTIKVQPGKVVSN